jgi:hypothetical protein
MKPEKVDIFRDSFYSFLEYFPISSRDKGRIFLGSNLYRAQKIFYEAVFDGLREDCHEFYLLKSRQLGISTGTRALTLFWLGMHESIRGGLIFDTAFNTAAARQEIEEALNNLPAKLHFPKIKSRNRDRLILENDSWLLFMQAGTRNSRAGGGLGRSLGLTMAHCSEISSWANDEGVTSFRQSLTDESPERLFIWESTGRGYGIWYRLWTAAKEDLITKRCIFAGWWSKDNQSIARTDARFPLYGTDAPNKRELERIAAVRDLYGWQITPEQLAWIRWKTDPAREFDEEDPEDTTTTQEQCWVEEDSFQQTGSSFFQSEKLSAASAKLANVEKPKVFKYWPNLDFVTSDIRPATTRREIEFRMWEEPVADSWYVVAADPAFGHDENNNNSAAQVLRCYADALDQVGEYTSASIQPHQFAWLLWTLIGYYGSTKPNCRVLFICELNGPGEEVWRQFQSTQQIVQLGYQSQAAREKGISDIFSNVQRYIYNRSDSMMSGHAWQWKTSMQNKVQIMEALRNYFHNGILTVNSMEAIEEMRTITRDGDTIRAENSNRDDRAFSLALGVRGWDEKIRRILVSGNRTREAERAKLSMSVEDQWALFQRNHLQNFFKTKEMTRTRLEMVTAKANWRAGLGVRRPMVGRR